MKKNKKTNSNTENQNSHGFNLDILFDYLTIRADRECIDFKLDIDIFKSGFNSGIRNFFGVQVNNIGFPIWDDQEPEKGFLNNFISWIFITKVA
jgi:hypothetical protein